MVDEVKSEAVNPDEYRSQASSKVIHQCDRCGFEMIEMNCKVVCTNCGNRFDCSDLNIFFD